jgi:hypothetical protein
MMSSDEWIHRGLEFAWKAWECRSDDRGGGGTGGQSQEIADELRWLDNFPDERMLQQGSSGQCLVSHFYRILFLEASGCIDPTNGDGDGEQWHQATCINEGMWLEAHYLASLLPLKSVTNLDYQYYFHVYMIPSCKHLVQVVGLRPSALAAARVSLKIYMYTIEYNKKYNLVGANSSDIIG